MTSLQHLQLVKGQIVQKQEQHQETSDARHVWVRTLLSEDLILVPVRLQDKVGALHLSIAQKTDWPCSLHKFLLYRGKKLEQEEPLKCLFGWKSSEIMQQHVTHGGDSNQELLVDGHPVVSLILKSLRPFHPAQLLFIRDLSHAALQAQNDTKNKKCLEGQYLQVSSHQTVGALKQQIQDKFASAPRPPNQHLVWKGNLLSRDDALLCSVGLHHGATVDLRYNSRGQYSGETMTLTFRCITNRTYRVEGVEPSWTAHQVKEHLVEYMLARGESHVSDVDRYTIIRAPLSRQEEDIQTQARGIWSRTGALPLTNLLADQTLEDLHVLDGTLFFFLIRRRG